MVQLFRSKRATATEAAADTSNEDVGRSSGVDEPISVRDGVAELKKFQNTHQWDYNLDYEQIATVNKALESDDLEKTANLEHNLLEEDSPYFEVRTSVRNYDEYVHHNRVGEFN